jgi:hypothetical protein
VLDPRRGVRRVGLGVACALGLALTGIVAAHGDGGPVQGAGSGAWRFAVSGDSRDCGDVVMPAIAAGVVASGASFYWHLGDFRKIYDFDEDMARAHQRAGGPLTILGYEDAAWDDFIRHQLVPFGATRVMLALGNHETIPPKTRADALLEFADWLATPLLRDQRLRDDPAAHRLEGYYHWVERGVDFITLDNATEDQFDARQVAWVRAVLARDVADPAIRTIVVGMHRALPDSLAASHSMNDSPAGEQSGRLVYRALLEARDKGGKRVYVLASHAHFFMEGVFNTAAFRAAGRVLPGWIVGTAGAVRYPLPAGAAEAVQARTNVYGYLSGEVAPNGEITFAFHPVTETDVPAPVAARYGDDLVRWCFAGNS